MDYKKFIKRRSIRLKILGILSFVPDQIMLKIQYRIKTGRKLNIKNPKRFTEKLQWYKLYYKNPLMIQCVDKYDVREYVKSKGLEKILIPCYGVYNSPAEIDWDSLPNQFVMKDTLGGGGTSVIVVTDKSSSDIELLKKRASEWVAIAAHKKNGGREWPYYSGKNHRIIIEQYIGDAENVDRLIDYKYFCFDGKTEFIYVMGDRKFGESVRVRLYDRNFNSLSVTRDGDEDIGDVGIPNEYKSMLNIAEKLSSDFPHVRVDLYNVNGRVLFGEMTFYNASGYMKYNPDSFDIDIGKKFSLRREAK